MKSDKHSIMNIVPFTANKKLDSLSLPNLVVSSVESKRRIDELQKFVSEMMVKGVDYGLVDGFSKPTLLKPGAEKLCDVFGFSKTVAVVNRIEKWNEGFFAYEVKMTLTRKDNGVIESEGLGSCNSKEATFRKQDPFTIVNTLLKMAKKRALIDAVLSATRSSGIFTQDIEDFSLSSAGKRDDESASRRQLQMIFALVTELNIRNGVAKELMKILYNVDHSTKLTKKDASSFIQDLMLLKGSKKNEKKSKDE